MRKGGGKGKGSAFEREIAKKIVKAFKPFGIHQRECWRSVLSGGHLISAGDLAMSDRLINLFPWAVEIKFYRKIDWWHFLIPASKKTRAWKEHQWLQQAIDGAKKRKGIFPLLVMKSNHGPTMVAEKWGGETGWRFDKFDDFLKKTVYTRQINSGKRPKRRF